MSKNILVAYFSASGVTEKVAQSLAKVAHADIYEIKPEVAYTKADLDWTDKKSRSTLEMNDVSARPAIADKITDMEQYDIVFVGFPIWWYVAPRIINTFLESYDFSGKTIIPFATSGSSGMGEIDAKLHAICPDTVSWLPGKLLNQASEKDLTAWVEGLNL